MSDVSGVRESRATDEMKRMMEESHEIEPGAAKKLHWHASHETMEHALAHRNDEVAAKAGELLGETAKKVGEEIVEHALRHGESPIAVARNLIVGAITSGALAPVAGGFGVAAAVGEVGEAYRKGDELAERGELDAIDVAACSVLDLDLDYRVADMAKHPGIVPQHVIDHLRSTPEGRRVVAELQTAADTGARAAFEALRCGGREEYFRVHPEAAQRVDADVAFNKGFESVLWAATQNDSARRLDAIRAKLESRDARATITREVRG